MSVTPTIKLVAYEDRQGNFVFVGVPDERGRYLRTDKSVVLVSCSVCKSAAGEPCKFSQGYTAGTHAARRSEANRRFGYGFRPADAEAYDAEAEASLGERISNLMSITLVEPRAV